MGRRREALTWLALLTACVQLSVSDGCGCQELQRREFDTKYTDDVAEHCKKCFTFVYDYSVKQNWTTRVCVRTPDPGPTPLLVVARQSTNAIAFAVPLSIKGDSSEFPSVCRTLCPVSRSGNTTFMDGTQQHIVLDFWSKSYSRFEFELQKIDNFAIGTKEPVTLNLTVSHPAVLQYSMPHDLSTVRVEANSNTAECMILSIEDIECPFHDTHETVPQGGYRQTHMKKSAITVKRKSNYEEFYIVLLLNPDDSECKDGIIAGIPGEDRFKKVTVEVIPVSHEWVDYAIWVPFVVILTFGIVCCICYHCQICIKIFPEVAAYQSTTTSNTEAAFIKNFYVMSDMAERKPWSSKSYQYAWNLGVVAVFYALPAIQLVYLSQLFMHASGNQDECYYNFRCAHQMELGHLVISDFNHVFSNVGYIILGLAFIVIVKSRESKDPNSASNKRKTFKSSHIALKSRNEPANQDGGAEANKNNPTVVYVPDESETGIPPHYGLYYSMGWALCMEGVMSLTYHICPKRTNFQFDTTFMYVISMICIARLYYARHQAIAPKAYSFWMMLAVSIFLPFLGLFSKVVFWILYVIWLICLIIMTFKYLVSPGACSGFRNLLCLKAANIPTKAYVNSNFREILMIFACLVHLAAVTFLGIIGTDLNTIILTFYIINVVWYCIYYIGMKIIYLKVDQTLVNFYEKVPWTSIVFLCFFLSVLFASSYFYVANRAEWKKTPAESRERNDHCLIGFNYYDNHDIWHFLSSISIFFLYLFLFTVDDDLKNKKMFHIVVF